ncbi:MAG TPA: GspH/FimT family pseudopilin [Candidatus Angelobacter sp.]|jgi:Tfp pilus assembly protein FimT|nr:GspH/FimT family pseudopilin [Candidatus Angelobacter sp.]
MGQEKGFSLIELMIVCVVLIIISAIAVPNIMQINSMYKLDAAGHAVASLLQQARMQAVKSNVPVYAKYDNATNMVFATDDPGNTYVAGNPDVAISSGLSFQATPPDHSQLDTYVSQSGGPAPQLATSIGFNARGLPCSESGSNASVCQSVTAGFEWFIQKSNGGWEAITVTPAGRIKSWRLSKPSGGTSACGYNACWQ